MLREGFRGKALGCSIEGVGFTVYGLVVREGFRGKALGCSIEGVGFTVYGLGFGS